MAQENNNTPPAPPDTPPVPLDIPPAPPAPPAPPDTPPAPVTRQELSEMSDNLLRTVKVETQRLRKAIARSRKDEPIPEPITELPPPPPPPPAATGMLASILNAAKKKQA